MEVRPGYKQTEVGIIPEDWDACNLVAISSKITDGDHLTPKRAREGNYLLSARNIRDSHVDLTDVDYVGDEEYKRMRQRCAPEVGDILMSCSGHGLGRVSAVPEGLRCVLVRSAALVKLNPRKADSLFIQYWLQGADAQNQISNSKSLAAQPNLFINSIERLRCVLPATVSEQRAIATALCDVDALLGTLDGLIVKKRDLKQAAMQQLLTGQTRLPGFTGEWEVKRLGDLTERFVGGGTPSRGNPAFWGKEIPWVTVKDFATFNPCQTQESITRIGLKNSASHLIPNGTLIASTRMALGKAVVYEVDVAINQDLKALFLKPGTSVRFLYYWFEHNARLIEDLGSGSTVKGISLIELRNISLPNPTLPEQGAIADVLSDMDAELETLEQRRAKTRDIKQAMMQELLTGNTRLVSSEASHA